MTRKGWGRTEKLFEGLTARERVRQMHIAARDSKREDPAIRKTLPLLQHHEFNDLIGQFSALHTILGMMAVDLRWQAEMMSHKLQLVVAQQQWGTERLAADELIGHSDWRSERGPGDPLDVVPGWGPSDERIALDDLSDVDQTTRGNAEIIGELLSPLLSRVMVIEVLVNELVDSLDIGEGVEDDVMEVIKDARQLLGDTGRWANTMFAADIDLEPEPDPDFMQMMRDALHLYRGPYRLF